jgi:hypothetical protein
MLCGQSMISIRVQRVGPHGHKPLLMGRGKTTRPLLTAAQKKARAAERARQRRLEQQEERDERAMEKAREKMARERAKPYLAMLRALETDPAPTADKIVAMALACPPRGDMYDFIDRGFAPAEYLPRMHPSEIAKLAVLDRQGAAWKALMRGVEYCLTPEGVASCALKLSPAQLEAATPFLATEWHTALTTLVEDKACYEHAQPAFMAIIAAIGGRGRVM